MSRSFDIPCTVEVAHNFAHFHAHVVLDGDIAIGAGDRVRVHGDRIVVPFGGSLRERRIATVTRARPWQRWWTQLKARFAVTELYEIGFSPGEHR
jgi:aromatic ring-cleaving dioxygenase